MTTSVTSSMVDTVHQEKYQTDLAGFTADLHDRTGVLTPHVRRQRSDGCLTLTPIRRVLDRAVDREDSLALNVTQHFDGPKQVLLRSDAGDEGKGCRSGGLQTLPQL